MHAVHRNSFDFQQARSFPQQAGSFPQQAGSFPQQLESFPQQLVVFCSSWEFLVFEKLRFADVFRKLSLLVSFLNLRNSDFSD